VAYDGAAYCGIAIQPNAPTVGKALLTAVQQLDPSVDKLRLSSRTDAGVHARDQRVAFDSSAALPTRGWVRELTKHLPPDVVVRSAAFMPAGFNPRFETTRKRYLYLLLCERIDDPFYTARAWRLSYFTTPECLEPLRRELLLAVGTHDFAAFASARDQREHTERTIHQVAVAQLSHDPSVVAIDITGDGFLHNMVRIMIGTLVDVARGHLEPGAISRALASRDRRDLGVTAPPDGLYLEQVMLTDEGADRWPGDNSCC